MKILGWIIFTCSVLSLLIWGAFDVTWWVPIGDDTNSGYRAYILAAFHIIGIAFFPLLTVWQNGK